MISTCDAIFKPVAMSRKLSLGKFVANIDAYLPDGSDAMPSIYCPVV